MKIRFIICVLVPFLSMCKEGMAQLEITPEQIEVRDGLSISYVRDLAQDKEGFIWAGTLQGLNRYNGKRFILIDHDPLMRNSPAEHIISRIAEKDNYLFLGYSEGCFDIMNKRTLEFKHIKLGIPEYYLMDNRICSNSVNEILIDKEGCIWVRVSLNVVRITIKSSLDDFFKGLDSNQNNLSLLHLDLKGYDLGKGIDLGFNTDSTEIIVAGQSFRTITVNCRSGEISDVHIPDRIKKMKKMRQVMRGGVIGISYFSEDSKTWVHYNGESWKVINFADEIRYIERVDEDQVLIIFNDRRVYYFDLRKNRPDIVTKNDAVWYFNYNYTVNPTITSLKDSYGNIWIGTRGSGIFKVNTNRTNIRKYLTGHSIYSPPFMDENGEIVHTGCYGLVYTPGFEKSKFFNVFQQEFTPDSLVCVAGIEMDNADRDVVWALRNQQLLKLTENGVQYRIKITERTRGVMNQDGESLVFAHTGVLTFFSKRNRSVRKYHFDSLIHKYYTVYALAKTERNVWWIATSKGLIKCSPVKDSFRFKLYNASYDYKNVFIGEDQILTLKTDDRDSGVLWVGTIGGLIRLNTRNDHFTKYTEDNGLSDNAIYGILTDDNNDLWISSNNGLIYFSHDRGLIRNFVREDGLQHEEFNTNAFIKAYTGELLFGGINGINVFHPHDLIPDTKNCKVYIDGLYVNNRPIRYRDAPGFILEQNIEFTKKIVLPAGSSNITLEFISLNFNSGEKNRYQYYLTGLEDPWANQSRNEKVSYMNLKPGRYFFRVRGTNRDGIWNSDFTELEILILAPWYWSTSSKTIYVILAVAALIAIALHFYRQMKLKHDHQLRKMEMKRMKEVDRLKSKMYIDITHELRTPLSLILGPAEKSMSDIKELHLDDVLKNQETIIRNGHRMLELVNQILNLNELQDVIPKPVFSAGDIVDYLKNILYSFETIAARKNIDLYFQSNADSYYTNFDKDLLLKIFGNLVFNACKYNYDGHYVLMNIEISKEHITIEIEDNGMGMTEEVQENIFNRYYKYSSEDLNSSGIGLALTMDLVTALEGQIEVESEINIGTTFTVIIPLRDELPASHNGYNGNKHSYNGKQINGEDLDSQLASLTGVRILIIDDVPEMRDFIAACLGNKSHFTYAIDGREGIEMALEIIPDIIICDVRMNGMDGFEVCKVLRENKTTSHVPIIFLTSVTSADSKLKAIECGADAFIEKPFNQLELILRIRQLLNIRKKTQSNFKVDLKGESHTPKPLNTAPTREDTFIKELRQIIEENLNNDQFSVDSLGQELGMSPYQLRKKILACTGMTPVKLIARYRVEQATNLLVNSDLNVAQIAYEVGFSDPQYFNRVFVKIMGETPMKFRLKTAE